jgi:hypothetical protein
MSHATLRAIDEAVRAHNAQVNIDNAHDPDWDHVAAWTVAFELRRFDESDSGAPVLTYQNSYAVSDGCSPNTSAALLAWASAQVLEDTEGPSYDD